MTTETPTIWYKGQRIARTVFQAILAGLPVLVAVLGVIAGFWSPEWLVATLAGSVAVQGWLAKIMANETVNAWLIAHSWLGSEPKAVAK